MDEALNVDVRVQPDHEAASRMAAELVLGSAAAAGGAAGGPRFSLVLSGGSTPRRLHELLAQGLTRALALDRVHLFWADERCVPPDDPRSNFGSARAALIDVLAFSPANIHRIRGEEPPETAAAVYAAALQSFFGSPEPRFDVAILGLGADGHTCSLFPGSPALTSSRPVAASRAPSGVEQRVTLTPVAFRRCRRAVFLVTGAEKAAAVARTLGSARDDAEESPAAAIRLEAGTVTWVLDEPAAAGLSPATGAAAAPAGSALPGSPPTEIPGGARGRSG
ncbi:MAG: 6-phosphogluconolactonase [Gemmatimonadetes bacterium]|nr:6-phosphogluconolactonase [Gemmatimonadota bacterium]